MFYLLVYGHSVLRLQTPEIFWRPRSAIISAKLFFLSFLDENIDEQLLIEGHVSW